MIASEISKGPDNVESLPKKSNCRVVAHSTDFNKQVTVDTYTLYIVNKAYTLHMYNTYIGHTYLFLVNMNLIFNE
jgi:hypothetical protein